MSAPIYLDYAATTPVDPAVAELMSKYLTMDGCFGNPSSRSHRYGWQAEEAVEEAREQVANLINADPREIVFTSGATESNNLAIKGAAQQYQEKGKHIITLKTEHKAVLDTVEWMAEQGFDVTFLDVQANGMLDMELFAKTLRDDTVLVSVMQVNNEIGVIQDIKTVVSLCAERGILVHVDAAQATGKLPIDVRELGVDLLSISAHKFYGPKGIGALYVKRKPKVRLVAQTHGGGHERGMRSGTLATHQIVGLGEACRLAGEKLQAEAQRILNLKQRFWQKVQSLPNVFVNGEQSAAVAGIINISFAEVEGEALLMALKDVAVSSGSACTSASLEPSYVLRALGVENELAHASIRFSFGRFTTEQDVDRAADIVIDAVSKLRQV
ncbi:IscS subfamily cysteine desulfurase [Paraneptunicella aestuarii]|uniref:IscS subfamily cysteine desulfurase n=1 Tax=Paraneptunicella aestuarii TaxID=2831148 RepID=UPI001E4CA98F|nr:IscS subfamily cysteine desulfurase [Paraneptunicella aestuarii]UAA39430.1 IscS subfamily cysteine desulfurase [Paraneptunicella aestuarii]